MSKVVSLVSVFVDFMKTLSHHGDPRATVPLIQAVSPIVVIYKLLSIPGS